MRIRSVIVVFVLLASACTTTTAGHPTAAQSPRKGPASSAPAASKGASSQPPTSGGRPAIAAGPDGGIVVGRGGKVKIELFEDADCPFCAKFESTDIPALQTLIAGGRASVEYQMVGLLDRNSNPPGYSTRAAAAAGCMPDLTSFAAFHVALFAHQPSEFGPGLSDEQLGELAQSSGAPSALPCINSQEYAGWVTAQTKYATDHDVTSIPMVFVDGKKIAGAGDGPPDLTQLLAAVHAAGS